RPCTADPCPADRARSLRRRRGTPGPGSGRTNLPSSLAPGVGASREACRCGARPRRFRRAGAMTERSRRSRHTRSGNARARILDPRDGILVLIDRGIEPRLLLILDAAEVVLV